jgi:ACS family D-galactonate transporter-like MFS transporter
LRAERGSIGLPKRRWRMAWLLSAGIVVTYFDRINLSVAADSLHAAFGLSLIGFGFLSSAFNWSYGAMQLPAGALLDRFGVKKVGRVGSFLWGCASLAGAMSPGIPSLFAARIMLGIAESPTFPANAKAIGEWFPPLERSLPMAITDAAAKFAAAVGVPIVGLILFHFGWRWAFGATGIVSLLYFVAFFFLYRSPEDDPKLTAVERAYIERRGDAGNHEELPARSFGSLLKEKRVWGLALGWGAYNYSFYMLLTWLPKYLSLTHGLDLLHSSLYTSIPWLFAAVADVSIGGWLVDRLILSGWNSSRVRTTAMVGGLCVGLLIWGAREAHSVAGALTWITLALCGLSIAAPVAWTVPSMIVPRKNVATVGAMANFCAQIAGISAPIVTGYLVTRTHSFSSAFATMTVVLLLGILGYGVLLGKIE